MEGTSDFACRNFLEVLFGRVAPPATPRFSTSLHKITRVTLPATRDVSRRSTQHSRNICQPHYFLQRSTKTHRVTVASNTPVHRLRISMCARELRIPRSMVFLYEDMCSLRRALFLSLLFCQQIIEACCVLKWFLTLPVALSSIDWLAVNVVKLRLQLWLQ